MTVSPGEELVEMVDMSGGGHFGLVSLGGSLVFFPFARYFVSLTLFIPSALSAGLFDIWQGILRPGVEKAR